MCWLFDMRTGELRSWKVDGTYEVLAPCSDNDHDSRTPGPRPCLFRAPTRNDMGGDTESYASQWEAAGNGAVSQCKRLEDNTDLQASCSGLHQNLKCFPLSAKLIEDGECVTMKIEARLELRSAKVCRVYGCRLAGGLASPLSEASRM